MERYRLPDPPPWAQIAGPLACAEDALARLDERLRSSPIRDGWIARTHFMDAAASLALDGSLVSLEDLVLHDARLDIRAPTPELTRAHAVLRARRRIASAQPGWALTPAGLDALRGRGLGADDEGDEDVTEGEGDRFGRDEDRLGDDREDLQHGKATFDAGGDRDDPWDAELAALDEMLARSDRLLAGDLTARHSGRLDAATRRTTANRTISDTVPLYDDDWDEAGRLALWRKTLAETETLPPVLAAAFALDAWDTVAPLQHDNGLGRLLASSLLRARAKTKSHLACLNVGLRAIRHERRQSAGPTARLLARSEAITATAERGLKDHDRWLLVRAQLEHKLVGRRSNSKLPALVDLVMASPVVSANLIADRLDVTPRAAQDMVADLCLREVTGRGRYRAWGVV